MKESNPRKWTQLIFQNILIAVKIVLAEELGDSVVKEEIQINEKTRSFIFNRLKRIEDGKATFFSQEEIQKKIRQLRNQIDS